MNDQANKFFLMRHGQSTANVQHLIVSAPKTGCAKYGLSPLGLEQAAQSAKGSGLGKSTVVYCSDFRRTRETAAEVARVLDCAEPMEDQRLRERFFGDYEGDTSDGYKRVWERDEADPNNTAEGVESPQALAERCLELLKDLEERHSGETILLVSHGDTLRFMQLAAANRNLREHLKVKLFEPAEIRELGALPQA